MFGYLDTIDARLRKAERTAREFQSSEYLKARDLVDDVGVSLVAAFHLREAITNSQPSLKSQLEAVIGEWQGDGSKLIELDTHQFNRGVGQGYIECANRLRELLKGQNEH